MASCLFMHSRLPFLRFSRGFLDELLVIVVVPIWAFDYTVVKIALQDVDPLFYAATRFLIASIILLVVWFVKKACPYGRKDWLRILAAGFSGVVLYQVGFTLGLRSISASESSLLITMAPIFTVLLAAAMQQKPLDLRHLVGGTIAFSGVGMLMWNGLQGASLSWAAVTGYLLTLMSALSFGFRSVVLQPTLERYPALPTVTMMIVTGTSLLLPLSARSLRTTDWHAIDTSAWLAIVYSAVLSTAVGYVLWYYGIGKIGATRTMIYYYFVPLLAIVFAVLVLDEEVAPLHLVGGVAIMTGVVLARSLDSGTSSGGDAPAEEKQK